MDDFFDTTGDEYVLELDDYNFTTNETNQLFPEIQPIQIATLVFYSLVVLLGVPGNALVVWVTGFCMSRSVTSLWFLNLALADLLCCLSVPLLMVPLAFDDHWHFGSLACTLVKGLFYFVMYCSILQLVVISLDRLVMVKKPIWCQNNRRPMYAVLGCVVVWYLSLLVSIPQFVYAREIEAGKQKRECVMVYTRNNVWAIASFRFIIGFILPFLVILICHLLVYSKTQSGLSRGRNQSKRTVKVIAAVVLTFFLCWLPLHILDFLYIATPSISPWKPTLYITQALAQCLAYFNSCLNPLIYVCMGRNFKHSMNRSLRNILHFATEDPSFKGTIAQSDTKSTSSGKEMTKI
uniref:C5a anaphylatoxin chemotactic receptor n=1 Tax=Nothobranchius kuhntae TaxID=321403 RepID=A0A1A8I1F6_NOTKU